MIYFGERTSKIPVAPFVESLEEAKVFGQMKNKMDIKINNFRID
jgi:hypothetical protein